MRTPGDALSSIAQAVSNASASNGDVIALLPGTHTATASIAASKAGLTFIGLPYLPVGGGTRGVSTIRPPVTITTSAADEAINVTAADNTFVNIRFLPVTQQKAVDYTAAADRLRFIQCMIDLTSATAHASTRGIFGSATTVAPSDIMFDRCVAIESNAGTTNGAAIDLGAAKNFTVQNCAFVKKFLASSVAWTSAVVVNDNASGTFAYNRVMPYGGAAGDAITNWVLGAALTNAAVVLFEGNIAGVNVTKFAEDFAAADCDLALNYVATVAGGTGGTLITATT
jgi:hypothetical protein